MKKGFESRKSKILVFKFLIYNFINKNHFLLIKCERSTYSSVAEPFLRYGTQIYVKIACFCEYKLLRGAADILL